MKKKIKNKYDITQKISVKDRLKFFNLKVEDSKKSEEEFYQKYKKWDDIKLSRENQKYKESNSQKLEKTKKEENPTPKKEEQPQPKKVNTNPKSISNVKPNQNTLNNNQNNQNTVNNNQNKKIDKDIINEYESTLLKINEAINLNTKEVNLSNYINSNHGLINQENNYIYINGKRTDKAWAKKEEETKNILMAKGIPENKQYLLESISQNENRTNYLNKKKKRQRNI